MQFRCWYCNLLHCEPFEMQFYTYIYERRVRGLPRDGKLLRLWFFFHIRIWQVFGMIWRTAFYFRMCLTLTISFWDYLIPMSFLEGVVHFVVACNCVNKKLKMLSTTPIKKEWVKCKWINREAKEKLTFIRNSNSCRSANGFWKKPTLKCLTYLIQMSQPRMKLLWMISFHFLDRKTK